MFKHKAINLPQEILSKANMLIKPFTEIYECFQIRRTYLDKLIEVRGTGRHNDSMDFQKLALTRQGEVSVALSFQQFPEPVRYIALEIFPSYANLFLLVSHRYDEN